jgi:hypothetical protein
MSPGVRSNDGEQRSSSRVICLRAGTVYVGARSALDIWDCCHIRYVLLLFPQFLNPSMMRRKSNHRPVPNSLPEDYLVFWHLCGSCLETF